MAQIRKLIDATVRHLKVLEEDGETDLMVRPRKSTGDPAESLKAFEDQISGCLKCPLGATRTKFVFGTGNPKARLMFIGEGPGFAEDRQGKPFVGPAGQLLTKIIEAMQMRREDVFIGNMVKCHPMIEPEHPDKRGNDRPPTAEEMAACHPYLQKQIAIIRPQVLCALGGSAAKYLLQSELGISKLRGQFFQISLSLFPDLPPFPLMPTYHPAALLRNPALKKDLWEDMKTIMKKLAEVS